MKCAILVQARMSSTRLPGKMLKRIGDMPLLEWVLRRCNSSMASDMTALLTSVNPEDDALSVVSARMGIPCFRGNLENTRQRYLEGARHFGVDVIVRVCGDSPFVDMDALDAMVGVVRKEPADYFRVMDTLNGFISEAFTLEALKHSAVIDDSLNAREHVTQTLLQRSDVFRQLFLAGIPVAQAKILPQLTVDTADDLRMIRTMQAGGMHCLSTAGEVLHNLLSICQMQAKRV